LTICEVRIIITAISEFNVRADRGSQLAERGDDGERVLESAHPNRRGDMV
jgi:hypothetical protein